MKNIKILSTIFCSSLLILSCDKDDDAKDTTPAVVTISEPHNEDAFAPGSEIHFDALFVDNVGLASYKVDIHFNGDGHAHKSNASAIDPIIEPIELEPWDFEKTGKLVGKSQEVHEHFQVPTLVNGKPIKEGEYDFGVYVIDAAGNQSVVWRKIDIMTGDAHIHE